MGFGQASHKVELKISAISKESAEKKAGMLSTIARGANEASLKLLAELAKKPNINQLLSEYESLLKSL